MSLDSNFSNGFTSLWRFYRARLNWTSQNKQRVKVTSRSRFSLAYGFIFWNFLAAFVFWLFAFFSILRLHYSRIFVFIYPHYMYNTFVLQKKTQQTSSLVVIYEEFAFRNTVCRKHPIKMQHKCCEWSTHVYVRQNKINNSQYFVFW